MCTRSCLSAADPLPWWRSRWQLAPCLRAGSDRQPYTAVHTRKQVAHLGASMEPRPVPRNAICMPDPLLSNLRLRSCVISSRVLHISSGGGLCGLALAGRAGLEAAAAPAAAAEELLGPAAAALVPAVFLVDCRTGTVAEAEAHRIKSDWADSVSSMHRALSGFMTCFYHQQAAAQGSGPTFFVVVLPLLSLGFLTAGAVCA